MKDTGETEARENLRETQAQEPDNSLPDVGGLQLEDQVSPPTFRVTRSLKSVC